MGFNKKFFTTGGIVASTPAGGNADLATATHVQNHSLAASSRGGARGGWISFDGTRVFTTHRDGSHDDYISQYNFGTAYDVSTIGSIVGEEQITAFIPDYLGGCVTNLDNTWISYDPYSTSNYYSQPFGTAGDITTLGSVSTDSCSRSGGDLVSPNSTMSKDGNYLFHTSFSTHRRISLSTAGDLSSGSGCGLERSTSGMRADLGSGQYVQGIQYNNDGTRVYAGGRNGKIAQYDLTTAYDINSRGSASVYDFSSDVGTSFIDCIQFNDDYTKMLLFDNTNDRICEFDL